jgi:hypothetical protein
VLDPGLHTIVISVGSRVAGRITVNGKPPPAPIPLRLLGEGWFFYADGDTDSAGRFEFRNLPPDWSGALELPPRS